MRSLEQALLELSLYKRRDMWTKRREGHMKTLKEDGNVKIQVEIGGMLPQAKEHLGLPETRKGKEGFSPRGF